MKKNKNVWLLLVAITLLLVTACSKKETTEGPELEQEVDMETIVAEEEVEEPEEEVITYQAPFSGVQLEEEITRRPVLATINNHPRARPQSGIGKADIIYEMAAEGNVTRFLALFQSELPDEIGPIRSARDYFVHIANGLDAFYVAHGYSPDAKQLLQNRFVDNLNGMQYDGIYFQRSRERKAPHNSYISGENILAGAEKTNSSMELKKVPAFSFHDSVETAKIGDTATSISVKYGSNPDFQSDYTYDELEGTYGRSVNGVPTIDKSDDTNVALSNVLLFETGHRTIDNEGRQDVDIKSGGNAYLFQAGVVKEIKWENRDGVLMPMENGVPAKLVPGQTWIHIVSTKPGMKTSVTYTP